MIVLAFVSSRLGHCRSLLTRLSKASIGGHQLVQEAAARLLTRSTKFTLTDSH